MGALTGKIAVVTGGTRGIGKGIALALGEAGATVYITGRTQTEMDKLEVMGHRVGGTLMETAAEVTTRGGQGIAVVCDHRSDEQVRALFDRVREEQGTLDLLVNNAYQWHESILAGKGFWELPLAIWDNQQMVGLRSAYVASVYAAQLMVPNKKGLIINISSPVAGGYVLATAYGVVKAALDRLSLDMAHELRPYHVASMSLWPGPIHTEKIEVLSKENPSPLHAKKDESPFHVGLVVAALAADPDIMKKSGQVMTTSSLGREYAITEPDGTAPPNVEELFWPPPPPPIYPATET